MRNHSVHIPYSHVRFPRQLICLILNLNRRLLYLSINLFANIFLSLAYTEVEPRRATEKDSFKSIQTSSAFLHYPFACYREGFKGDKFNYNSPSRPIPKLHNLDESCPPHSRLDFSLLSKVKHGANILPVYQSLTGQNVLRCGIFDADTHRL